MARGWTYWPGFVFKNLYGIGLIAVLLVGGCRTLVKSLFAPAPDLPHAAVGLLLMMIPIGGFLWFRSRDIRTATEMLAKINPLILTFDANGLHTLEKSGAHNFMPWSRYDGFREGGARRKLNNTELSVRRPFLVKLWSNFGRRSDRACVRSVEGLRYSRKVGLLSSAHSNVSKVSIP
jgi:hypothetical protein